LLIAIKVLLQLEIKLNEPLLIVYYLKEELRQITYQIYVLFPLFFSEILEESNQNANKFTLFQICF